MIYEMNKDKKVKYCPLSFAGNPVSDRKECNSNCAWYDEETGKCRMLSAFTEIAYQLEKLNEVDGIPVYKEK